MVTTQSWEALATAARAGDRSAADAVCRRLVPYLRKVAAAVRRLDEDDLVQAGLVRVWRQLGRYDPARPFLPWARLVAKRAMLSACRQAAEAVGFEDGYGFGVADRPPQEPETAGLPAWWTLEVMQGLDDRERAELGERFGLVGAGARTGRAVALGRGATRQAVSARLADSLAAMRVAFHVRYGGGTAS